MSEQVYSFIILSVMVLTLLTVLALLMVLRVLTVLMLLAILMQLDGFGCADIQSWKVSQTIENLHCVAALKLAAEYIPQ